MILTIVGCDNHSESGNSDVMNTTKSEESKYVADMRSTTVSSSKDSIDDSSKAQVTTTTKEETSTSNHEDSKVETSETTTEAASKGVESPTESLGETPTEALVVEPTVPVSEPVEIPMEPTTSKYDISSTEYQNEVKQLTIQYINQYRASEGQVALSESPSASAFAQGRSKQLIGLKVFEHNIDDIRALATEMKYGRYINPQEFGARGEPYYEAYGIEAISKQTGNQYFSADEVAKKIAKGFYNSKEHWQYVGGVGSVYVNDVYCGIGISYRGGYWYTCIRVQDQYDYK